MNQKLDALPDILRIEAIAATLDCSKSAVYGECARGSLASFKIGRLLRVRKSELLRWMAAQETKEG
jgi:excisionase family DNA binding protein